MIPGANLLNMAFGLITAQVVQYRQYLGKTTNAVGVDVVQWGAPVPVRGSLQPVDTTLIAQLGLDMEKTYVTFYTTRDAIDLARDRTGDRLSYGGAVYQVTSKANWKLQDGWVRVLCVEVSNA